MVVRESETTNSDGPTMYEFEALTMVPFDRRLIDVSLLTPEEVEWVNNYHTEVYEKTADYVQGAAKDWLTDAVQAI